MIRRKTIQTVSPAAAMLYMSEADAKAQGERPDHNKPCS
jgi:hypothetical protein